LGRSGHPDRCQRINPGFILRRKKRRFQWKVNETLEINPSFSSEEISSKKM
jgi:hypothetical protein